MELIYLPGLTEANHISVKLGS